MRSGYHEEPGHHQALVPGGAGRPAYPEGAGLTFNLAWGLPPRCTGTPARPLPSYDPKLLYIYLSHYYNTYQQLSLMHFTYYVFQLYIYMAMLMAGREFCMICVAFKNNQAQALTQLCFSKEQNVVLLDTY